MLRPAIHTKYSRHIPRMHELEDFVDTGVTSNYIRKKYCSTQGEYFNVATEGESYDDH